MQRNNKNPHRTTFTPTYTLLPSRNKTLRKPERYMDISLKRKREKKRKKDFLCRKLQLFRSIILYKNGQQIKEDLTINGIFITVCVDIKGNFSYKNRNGKFVI